MFDPHSLPQHAHNLGFWFVDDEIFTKYVEKSPIIKKDEEADDNDDFPIETDDHFETISPVSFPELFVFAGNTSTSIILAAKTIEECD